MTLASQKSTFPIALGVRITGVDDATFSQTGESYSMISMPNADSHNARVLQEDNTELAYEAKSIPLNQTHVCPRNSTLTPSPACSRSSRASSPGESFLESAALHCTH